MAKSFFCIDFSKYHLITNLGILFNRVPIFTILAKMWPRELVICRALTPLRACYWQFEYLTVENQLKCCWCSRKYVVFNVKDRILVENLYKFKGYRAKKNSKFPDKVGPLMVWNICWRNWETPVPKLGNQEV